MKPYIANLVNALVLIVMGTWGYLSSENPSGTALIPVGFGIIFLLIGGLLALYSGFGVFILSLKAETDFKEV